MKQTIIIPRVSEKAYAQSANGVYVLRVPLNLNKNEIKSAVEEQFGVTVVKVKTLVQDGKAVRFSRGKNRYPGTTTRKDWKKAYVTLKEGDKLDVFDAVEQQMEETKLKSKMPVATTKVELLFAIAEAVFVVTTAW